MGKQVEHGQGEGYLQSHSSLSLPPTFGDPDDAGQPGDGQVAELMDEDQQAQQY